MSVLSPPATPAIYTLSLHDALPISRAPTRGRAVGRGALCRAGAAHRRRRVPGPGADEPARPGGDRKSTRLNSSHTVISYAVFCLKKKNNVRMYEVHKTQ